MYAYVQNIKIIPGTPTSRKLYGNAWELYFNNPATKEAPVGLKAIPSVMLVSLSTYETGLTLDVSSVSLCYNVPLHRTAAAPLWANRLAVVVGL